MDPATFADERPQFCDMPEGVAGWKPPLPDTSARLVVRGAQELVAAMAQRAEGLPPDGQGLDATGFYLSFRRGADAWGLYLHPAGLRDLADRVRNLLTMHLSYTFDPIPPEFIDQFCLGLATGMALGHHKLHYFTDFAAAAMEEQSDQAKYRPYLEKVYWPTFGVATEDRSFNHEEALATAEAFRTLFDTVKVQTALQRVLSVLDEATGGDWQGFVLGGRLAMELVLELKNLPPGYRNFTAFMQKGISVSSTSYASMRYTPDFAALDRGRRKLMGQLWFTAVKPEEPPLELTKAIEATSRPDPPVYLL